MTTISELTCRELVELVTLYLEDGMPSAERTRFEEHIVVCGACAIYLDQVRETSRLAGTLAGAEQALTPETRDALLQAFRGWKER